MHDREEKYEGDDTEYHFSDEEINYDMDAAPEAPKEASVAPTKSGMNIASLLQSKRIIMSVVVFFILVVVVFKMISPSGTSEPDTDIQSIPTVPTIAKSHSVATPAMTQTYNTNTTAKAPSMAVQAATQTVQMPGQTVAPAPVVVEPAPVIQPAAPAPVVAEPAPVTQPAAQPAPASQTYTVPGANDVDTKVATLAAQNERLMAQLQAQYDERIKEYQTQNQGLQEQVKTLSSQVSGMETQLSKMMQGHANKPQAQGLDAVPGASSSFAPSSRAQPKVPYTVQAIIPGRAWLKSDNGETITVAEGDMIKSVGKVTKIDPYDGIVEINTGSHVVALSYGSGG